MLGKGSGVGLQQLLAREAELAQHLLSGWVWVDVEYVNVNLNE
jgi:hypothetical protein